MGTYLCTSLGAKLSFRGLDVRIFLDRLGTFHHVMLECVHGFDVLAFDVDLVMLGSAPRLFDQVGNFLGVGLRVRGPQWVPRGAWPDRHLTWG